MGMIPLVNSHGLVIDTDTKAYIYNSTLIGNTGYGLAALLLNGANDLVLVNSNTFGNEDGGVTFSLP